MHNLISETLKPSLQIVKNPSPSLPFQSSFLGFEITQNPIIDHQSNLSSEDVSRKTTYLGSPLLPYPIIEKTVELTTDIEKMQVLLESDSAQINLDDFRMIVAKFDKIPAYSKVWGPDTHALNREDRIANPLFNRLGVLFGNFYERCLKDGKIREFIDAEMQKISKTNDRFIFTGTPLVNPGNMIYYIEGEQVEGLNGQVMKEGVLYFFPTMTTASASVPV